MSNKPVNLQLQKALREMTNENLIQAIQEARLEAESCSDEKEWKLIIETTLVIGKELERRGLYKAGGK